MKKGLLMLAVVALAVSALASTPSHPAKKKPHVAPPTHIKCAVMPENEVDIKTATKKHLYADYKGRRYYFCCGDCPEMFKRNPAKYAKAASLPIPHVKKAAAHKKSTKKH